MAARTSSGDTSDAVNALAASYKSVPAVTIAEAKAAVSRLEKALVDCGDAYIGFRIRYRTGVICFKARMMETSEARFSQIANEPNCPELIRICSFNMIGQITRLEGRDREALAAFDRAANLLEQRLAVGPEHCDNPAMVKLCCSVLFSSAEICEQRREYAAAITAYSRLLRVLSKSKNIDLLKQYGPLAIDRISQLYLRQGRVAKYMEMGDTLITNYPEYYRVPIVELEIECVKVLKVVAADCDLSGGGFGAPAQAIGYIKNSGEKTSAGPIVDKLDRLCRKYQTTYGGILLQYHYAWFLDALGEKDKAMKVLGRIASIDFGGSNHKFWESRIIETTQEYAKTQYAVMLTEKEDYGEALRVLGSLRTHPDKSHIAELANSLTNCIQILKREVPKNENE
ncbi:MAG TPA: hypothetical protein VMW16_06310 [Sedimentisphaerales bacterium]|nr:hypothetical protein [Sedimentisphaerales bacterium]